MNKKLKEFSLVWTFIFIVVAIYPLLNAENIRLWSLFISAIFIVIAFFKPSILKSFYKIWIKFGEVIGGIVSKIIMFILYFGLFTPVSIVLKILGKDLLNKKVDKSKNTYWIKRERQPESMKNQF